MLSIPGFRLLPGGDLFTTPGPSYLRAPRVGSSEEGTGVALLSIWRAVGGGGKGEGGWARKWRGEMALQRKINSGENN